MKFSSLLSLAFSGLAMAQIDITNPEGSGLKGEYVDPSTLDPVPFKYDIQYTIVNHAGSVLEIYNGEEITLNYTVTNNEDEEINIVGVGGNFGNPVNGEVIANITDAKVGPVTIGSGESKWFTQRIGVNLPSSNYVLNPGLYVVKGSTLAMLGANSTLTIVADKPVSLFAPELIVLELLLVLTLAVGGYFFYNNFGAQYLKTTGLTASAQKSSTKQTTSSAASTSGSKATVDDSWLPDHIKKTNKKKAN
ncbi:Increased recombination centers protein 22 [Cyberlindnera fabianii]|uniref:Increased recombination centers protein 22 n=1 Tax=Cyberlindnera fabianii TaxID=36022 RepID=A0A1V2L7T2_CYBFA|nr:Increased recombination centers protein 22 [Cyberlindnera fabianii]